MEVAEQPGPSKRAASQEPDQPGNITGLKPASAPDKVRRSKKQRKNASASAGGASGASGGTAAANGAGGGAAEDVVRVVPVPKRSEILQEGWRPVLLSRYEKAAQMVVSDDRKSVTSFKGYRMVRASHGVHQGSWYFEVHVKYLGETGHCRLGWSRNKGELHAPVGYDAYSAAYRDLDGSKVHKAWREQYGAPYREGDVIGCLLSLPPGGRPMKNEKEDIVKWKGALVFVEEKQQEPPRPLEGSLLGFAKNGEWQGVAFTGLEEGTYYPAVSIFTLPEQREGATLELNFGPDFKYPPPKVEGCPAPQPMCDAAGTPPPNHQQQQAGGIIIKPQAAAAVADAGSGGGGKATT